jgi:hypothetical protein
MCSIKSSQKYARSEAYTDSQLQGEGWV